MFPMRNDANSESDRPTSTKLCYVKAKDAKLERLNSKWRNFAFSSNACQKCGKKRPTAFNPDRRLHMTWPLRTVSLMLANILVIFCYLACYTNATVTTGDGVTSKGRGIELSLLDYNQIVLSETSESGDGSPGRNYKYIPRRTVSKTGENSHNHRSVGLDGFNLLWLIASKLRSSDKLIRIEQRINNSPSKPNKLGAPVDTDEIFLDSAWPRQYLRYGKKITPFSRIVSKGPDSSFVVPPLVTPHLLNYFDSNSPILNPPKQTLPKHSSQSESAKNDVVRINRFIVGNSIGFEMEFRMEQQSGSGYIIAARSLNGQPIFTPLSQAQYENSSSTNKQESWFGLYALTRTTSYNLRLEYRNQASKNKNQLQIRFSDNFRKGEWQKLAVNIDFNANTMNYWVNCSARPTVELQANLSHPSSFYSVYRLLQHKRHSILPIKVTFREVIMTDGNRRTVPRHCEDKSEQMTVCPGGKIYMPCGPSCERTCKSYQNVEITDDYLRTCAIACVSGCHCPPGYVTHNGRCTKPENCPCLLGSVTHDIGVNLTINNELCNCVKGRWSCYAIPQMTHKPRNLTLRAGRTSQLSCTVSGNPLPTITWEVPETATYFIVKKDGGRGSILVLRNVSANEVGIYKCKATLESKNWEIIAQSTVRVVSRPIITLPQTIPVTRGYPFVAIDCVVSGQPRPRVIWIRDNKKVIPNDRIQIFWSGPGVLKLKIHNVQSTDAGEWVCHARNAAGYSRRAVRILIRLPEPNSMAFYRKPVDQYVKRGHTAIFNCEILDHQYTNVNVTWLHNGRKVDLSGKRKVMKRSRLVLRQIRDEDAGVYTCIVKVRRRGQGIRAKANLAIKGQMLPWSDWSQCSATCNGGIMFKRRTCTGIPPNDKTCHGKFTHLKRCNTQVCPGVCTAIGDPHYTTFDGRRFNFHGDCGYVLSHDANGNEFKVLLYNGRCGPRLSCLNSVTVILTMPGLASVVDMQKGGSVTVNSAHVELPYLSPDSALIIDKIGLFTVLNAGNDFELKWARPHRLYLTIGPKYFGRTQGFCGNYNDDQTDDNILPTGRPTNSDQEFGLNWSLSEGTIDYSCTVLGQRSQPCDRVREWKEAAHDACSFLLDQTLFGPCHSKVSPMPYIEDCTYDICSTSERRTSVYFCVALAAYADECLRKGVVLDWRSNDICKEHCFSGMVYKECGPRCVRYCPNVVNEFGKICAVNGNCISGCHCPDDMVLHGGRCITVDKCPCVDSGKLFGNNTRHNRNCEKCVCINGNWECTFNKDLCEFPSSLIRGPVSQVIPSGKSASFCCEAAGIPTPEIEWYRDGRLIPLQTQRREGDLDAVGSGNSIYGYAKTDMKLENITSSVAGVYTCKATNALGSQMSDPAILTVVAPWIATCNPIPSKHMMNLPEGCYVKGPKGPESSLDVGQCLGLPCFYDSPTNDVRQSVQRKCGRTRQCCRPSVTSPVSVSCTHPMYSSSFSITTVKKCSCAMCGDHLTVVEGALKTAITGSTLRLAKIIHRGRVVGYTSNTGSFRVSFLSLPEDARYVTLTFVDVMFKRFPATVKNLPVIFGEVTIHTVFVNARSFRVRFDASLGLRHISKSLGSRSSERIRLIIPPSSLRLQRTVNPFVGQVDAVVSIVKRDYEIDKQRLHTVPGHFVGINLKGSKQIMLPAYILTVSLYNRYGRALELLPDRSAIFLVNTIAFGGRIQPWFLDELTGLWRERQNKIEIAPAFNKRAEKVLQLTAKIPRLNTAWALSDSEPPCYVQVRVLDTNNNTVPGVRVVMTTTDEVPDHSSAVGRRTFGSGITQMQTMVESLTRVSDINGVCMPIGCKRFGYISASKQDNSLALLPPDAPPPAMGRITSNLPHLYGVSSVVVPSDDDFDLNYLSDLDHGPKPPTSLYFHKEEDCIKTATDKRTYIFRDNTQTERNSGFLAASRNPGREKTLINDNQNGGRTAKAKSKPYCHVKISVTITDRVTPLLHQHGVIQMMTEAVTFGGGNETKDMSIIGWSREKFRTPPRRPVYMHARSRRYRNKIRKTSEEVCIEYLCGEQHPFEFLYVSVRSTAEDAKRSGALPVCEFVRSVNHTASSGDILRNFGPESMETSFSKGGYIFFPPKITGRKRPASRRHSGTRNIDTTTSSFPESVFSALSLVESKNKCLISRDESSISAWFKCS